jgi:anthranilate/para-aminobenzoate synthase component I
MSKPFVTEVSTVDSERLQNEVHALLIRLDAFNVDQLSLTSSTGEDNWDESVGRMTDLKFPEKYYRQINESLNDTYIHELTESYPDFYRWRLLRLDPKATYTVHKDSLNNKTNIRLHIPVWTNTDALLCFYDRKPDHRKQTRATHYHLEEGKVYEVNTSDWHTAVNYGEAPRYHIVGVKYE